MSYQQYRDRELRHYQDRVYQLEQENLALRGMQSSARTQHCSLHQHNVDPYANSVLGIYSKIQSYRLKIRNWKEKLSFIKCKLKGN